MASKTPPPYCEGRRSQKGSRRRGQRCWNCRSYHENRIQPPAIVFTRGVKPNFAHFVSSTFLIARLQNIAKMHRKQEKKQRLRTRRSRRPWRMQQQLRNLGLKECTWMRVHVVKCFIAQFHCVTNCEVSFWPSLWTFSGKKLKRHGRAARRCHSSARSLCSVFLCLLRHRLLLIWSLEMPWYFDSFWSMLKVIWFTFWFYMILRCEQRDYPRPLRLRMRKRLTNPPRPKRLRRPWSKPRLTITQDWDAVLQKMPCRAPCTADIYGISWHWKLWNCSLDTVHMKWFGSEHEVVHGWPFSLSSLSVHSCRVCIGLEFWII